METLRVLGLLLQKNFIVRKRHWKSSLFGEFLLPMALMAVLWFPLHRLPKSVVYRNPTYHHVNNNLRQVSASDSDFHISWTPNNSFTEELMSNVISSCVQTEPYASIENQSFSTEAELVEFFKSESSVYYSTALVFNANLDHNAKQIHYKFLTWIEQPPGLLAFQVCIDQSFINIKRNASSDIVKISSQQVPDPPFIKPFLEKSQIILYISSLILVALCTILLIETGTILNEKCSGVNVLMSLNGVSNSLNIFSWVLSGLIFLTFAFIAPNAYLGAIERFNEDASTATYVVVLSIMYLLNTCHLLTFGVHVSAYFKKSAPVSFVIMLTFFGAIGLRQIEPYAISTYLGIIFPQILLFRAIEEVYEQDLTLDGLQFKNLFVVMDKDYGFADSLGMVFILSVVGTIFHFALAIYLYAINPGVHGAAKSPFFFLKLNKKKNSISIVEETESADANSLIEPVSGDTYQPGIQIRNLTKSYRIGLINRREVSALNGVSIDFYKGQITSLLGHNGAGKTTMMGIITGMLGSSGGTVLFGSQNMQDSSREVKNDMGLCTQTNMVFPHLTVEEQLLFFAKLKNKAKNNVEKKRKVKDLLEKLRLYEKKGALPKDLSGGQKRRLCLGMALIGDASILILDEPTSGLDPESRRVIWNIILKERGHKTILISTHDMEEADVLGDRIAILYSGQLKCYGSPMFLKNLLGENSVDVTLSLEPGSDPDVINRVFGSSGKITSIGRNKISINVPKSRHLADSLDNLERSKPDLGITGISVSIINLEQLFLKVTEEKNEIKDQSNQKLESFELWSTGFKLYLDSIKTFLCKKITYTWKNSSTILLMLLYIILGLLTIAYVSNGGKIGHSLSEIPISLESYDHPITYYKSDFKDYGDTYRKISEKFGGKAVLANDSSVSEALVKLGSKDEIFYDKHLIASAEFNRTINNGVEVKIVNALYSAKKPFSESISLNLITNAICQSAVDENCSISLSRQTLRYPGLQESLNGYTLPILLALTIYNVVANFVVHPSKELSTGMKHLQKMTRAPIASYWIAMFIFDFVILLTFLLLVVLGFYSLDTISEVPLLKKDNIVILVSSFLLFAMNVLPMVYILSFLNINTSSIVRILNSYLPTGSIVIILVSEIVPLFVTDPFVKTIINILRDSSLLIPYVNFLQNQRYFFDPSYKDVTLQKTISYYLISTVLSIWILVLLEKKAIQRLWINKKKKSIADIPVDNNVKKEKFIVEEKIAAIKNRRSNSNSNGVNVNLENFSHDKSSMEYPFLVNELQKNYGQIKAVKGISFGVKKQECFGLLGVNGAGKSTAFKMMTDAEIPDNGVMYLNNINFRKDSRLFLSQMGYCPQNDALISSLNAYDHLRLFARLRGVPEAKVQGEVQFWINKMNLIKNAKQPTKTYSGGTKRKLNLAIALIGKPHLLLLDEPTTGIDPGARRSLWNVVKSCQDAGISIILTSHSMDECEFLCNRLTIMVNGQLVCIGSTEELKQLFGTGHNIMIKINPEKANDQIVEMKKEISEYLECQLVDEHMSYLMFHVLKAELSWKEMYEAMYSVQNKYDCVEDFSVVSATLEQLFLFFARKNEYNNSPSLP